MPYAAQHVVLSDNGGDEDGTEDEVGVGHGDADGVEDGEPPSSGSDVVSGR